MPDSHTRTPDPDMPPTILKTGNIVRHIMETASAEPSGAYCRPLSRTHTVHHGDIAPFSDMTCNRLHQHCRKWLHPTV